tara:strand:+ start:7440 stop:7667 length:228 start_codon:yes stop_codon:yes gene_type:complete
MKLDKEELENIRTINTRFLKLKNEIADVEIIKYGLLQKLDEHKSSLSKVESDLIGKYGADAVIDIKTGDVTIPKK